MRNPRLILRARSRGTRRPEPEPYQLRTRPGAAMISGRQGTPPAWWRNWCCGCGAWASVGPGGTTRVASRPNSAKLAATSIATAVR